MIYKDDYERIAGSKIWVFQKATGVKAKNETEFKTKWSMQGSGSHYRQRIVNLRMRRLSFMTFSAEVDRKKLRNLVDEIDCTMSR